MALRSRPFIAFGLLMAAWIVIAARPRDPSEGARVYGIPSDSMQPLLNKGDQVLVDESAYLAVPPARGEVVIYRAPAPGDAILVKRVVGIPGDTIEILHKKLLINGAVAIEPYAIHTDPADLSDQPAPIRNRDSFGPVKLQPGEYFLLGDNRDAAGATDSRTQGAVLRGLIQAKVLKIRHQAKSDAARPDAAKPRTNP